MFADTAGWQARHAALVAIAMLAQQPLNVDPMVEVGRRAGVTMV